MIGPSIWPLLVGVIGAVSSPHRLDDRAFVLEKGGRGRALRPTILRNSSERFQDAMTTLPTPARLLDSILPGQVSSQFSRSFAAASDFYHRQPVQTNYQSANKYSANPNPRFIAPTAAGSHGVVSSGYGQAQGGGYPQPYAPQTTFTQPQAPPRTGYAPWSATGGTGQSSFVPSPGHNVGGSSHGFPAQVAGGSYGSAGRPPAACSVDSSCYSRNSDCAVSGSYPYDRRTPYTCEECLALCQAKAADPEPYRCKAAVYDFHWKSCDLFAVTVAPQKIVGYQGRDLFRPTGGCTGGPSPGTTPGTTPRTTPRPTVPGTRTTVVPTSGDCPAGQEVRYIEIPNNELITLDGETFQGQSLEDCIEGCTANARPDTLQGSVPCRTFNYIGDGAGICLISPLTSPEIVAEQGAIELTPTQGSSFYEKVCVDSQAGQRCTGTIIREPNKILIGLAVEVVNAQDFDQCLNLCLDSQEIYGFACASGMFYFDEGSDENCILNTESAETEPNLLVEEDRDPVDYFQLGGCELQRLGRFKTGRVSQSLRGRRFPFRKDLPLTPDVAKAKDGQWTTWTACKQSAIQRRYRRCDNKKDIRKCPRAIRRCRPERPRSTSAAKRSQSLARVTVKDVPKRSATERFLTDVRRPQTLSRSFAAQSDGDEAVPIPPAKGRERPRGRRLRQRSKGDRAPGKAPRRSFVRSRSASSQTKVIGQGRAHDATAVRRSVPAARRTAGRVEGLCYAVVHPVTGQRNCRRGVRHRSTRSKRKRFCARPIDC